MNLLFLACFLSNLALIFASNEFTCDLELRHDDMGDGVVLGKIHYDWSAGRMLNSFKKGDYNELYHFNSQRGYGDKNYDGQWLYRIGSSCGCETGSAQMAMPALYEDQDLLTKAGNGYKPKSSKDPISTVQFSGQFPSYAEFKDGRKITFKNCKSETFSSSFFDVESITPDGQNVCTCGKPLDIVLVLDRSSSISILEFKKEREFTIKLAESFEYGPLAVNMGITNFKWYSWDHLHLNSGNSLQNVVNGAKSLQCDDINGSGDSSCQCCGTAVSSGIRNGAMMLKDGPRESAGKVLITLTDGYHNRPFVGINRRGDPYGQERGHCNSDRECNADLQQAVDFAKREVPRIKMFAISVGVDRAALAGQLEIIADGDNNRIFESEDFDKLPAIVEELVAKTCDENDTPCGQCCGFCTCGVCSPPDLCEGGDLCMNSVLGGVCCVSEPPAEDPCDVDEQEDKCWTYECDDTMNDGKGGCKKVDPTPVPDDKECFRYKCEPSTGEIVTEELDCQVIVPECLLTEDDCDDKNECTEDKCVLKDENDPQSGHCVFTDKPPCDDNNKCTDDKCSPSKGCVFEPKPADFCDDNNLCTTDECVPEIGCQHSNITCDETDVCHNSTCDPFFGCQIFPIVCPSSDNCTIAFCETENDTGCDIRQEECGVPIGAIAGIAGGVIAGIVAAAVVGALMLGGGTAYAFTQGAGSPLTTSVANNPLYTPDGSSGSSPFYRA